LRLRSELLFTLSDLKSRKIRLGVLASHAGTNLQAIIDACASGQIHASVEVVISNNSSSYALERAQKSGIQAVHMSRYTNSTNQELDLAICTMMKLHRVDLVILAGYMKKIGVETLKAYPNRILNSHPSLMPNYCGPGMYGDKVHKAVLAAGEKETGVTIHLVDEEYDHGSIVDQVKVPLKPDESLENLIQNLKSIEHAFWVNTIEKLQKGVIDLDSISVDSDQ